MNNLCPYIIPLTEYQYKRGKKIFFKVKGDDELYQATYIRSSIKGIKSPKITWDYDEYYLFNHKQLGAFILEKDIIYEKNIDCSKWSDLIAV